MEIAFTQDFYYSNKKQLPIGDVARALLALEGASKPIADVLEEIYDDVTVQNISLELEELHSGSLSERVKYYLKVALQKQIEKESGVELKQLDDSSEKERSNIAGWVAAALILIALKAAGDKVWPSREKQNIEQQINITLATGSEMTGVPVDALRSILQSVVKEQPEVVKSAVAIAKPAKRDPEAEITLNEKPFLSKESLAEVPSAILQDDPQEKVIELEQAEVYIRATDKDSGRRGWGATIPDFSESRLRLHIAPGIDLVYLAHCDVVIGEVAIFYTVDGHGNVVKPHAHLFSIDRERTDAVNR